jgi:hypothetical protein
MEEGEGMPLILTPELVAAADAERARHLATMRACQRRLRARRAAAAGREVGRNGRPRKINNQEEAT